MVRRKFKTVSREENLQLHETFPGVRDLLLSDLAAEYKKSFVSTFSAWPSADVFIASLDNAEQFYDRHYSFNRELVQLFDCRTLRFRGRKKVQLVFKRFTSPEAAIEYVQPSPCNINGKFYFNLLIPELKLVYLENVDFTHVVCYQDAQLAANFFDLAEKNGLHILK